MELWKLPKAQRKDVSAKIESLKANIRDHKTEVERLENLLADKKWVLQRDEKELTLICKNHNLNNV